MSELYINKINAYENDEMTHEEEIAFMQSLINGGNAWKLQGHYGLAAQNLIDQGLCKLPE